MENLLSNKLIGEGKIMLTLSKIYVSLFVALTSAASAQTPKVISADDPRPLATISDRLEQLSHFSINYEDVRYEHSSDIVDVTATVLTAAQKALAPPGTKILVPKGAAVSVTATVNQEGRIADFVALSSALQSAVDGFNRGSNGGKYIGKANGQTLLIEPSQYRNSFNQIVQATPVLSTPLSIDLRTRTGMETLSLVVERLSQVAGKKVVIGTIPIRQMATTNVTIGAEREPAGSLLLRLFSAMGGNNLLSTNSPIVSYRLFFDPKQQYYVLNIHALPRGLPAAPGIDVPTPVVPPGQNPYFLLTPAK